MGTTTIGTLNEKPLHEALKRWYAHTGDRFEVPVDSSVVDIVRGDMLIEIQTRNFSAIKRKLKKLLEIHRVRLVYPIPREKWIVKLRESGGSAFSRRRSPKHGMYAHVFEELVRLPDLCMNPKFSLEILLTEEEEVRRYDGVRGWRRGGWVTEERRLLRVVETRVLAASTDLMDFVPEDLVEPFSVTELAAAGEYPRRLAQKIAYCLRATGGLAAVGKRGNAVLYKRRLSPAGIN